MENLADGTCLISRAGLNRHQPAASARVSFIDVSLPYGNSTFVAPTQLSSAMIHAGGWPPLVSCGWPVTGCGSVCLSIVKLLDSRLRGNDAAWRDAFITGFENRIHRSWQNAALVIVFDICYQPAKSAVGSTAGEGTRVDSRKDCAGITP